MTSGGSRRRECLKPAKKQALRRPERCAAQVQPCLSLPEPPPPGGKTGTVFPALVPGTGTLPVGFQGRSALVAKGEIPVQEICTWREIQEIRVFLLDRTRIFGYIVSVIFKFIVIR